jgi:hypothetical protein
MKKSSIISSLWAMGMAMAVLDTPTYKKEEREKPTIYPKNPAGTKEYFFNDSGEFSTKQMRKDETVFKCFAINDKNAIKKFKNWKTTNS